MYWQGRPAAIEHLLSNCNDCFSSQPGNLLLDEFNCAFLKVNHRQHVYLTAPSMRPVIWKQIEHLPYSRKMTWRPVKLTVILVARLNVSSHFFVSLNNSPVYKYLCFSWCSPAVAVDTEKEKKLFECCLMSLHLKRHATCSLCQCKWSIIIFYPSEWVITETRGGHIQIHLEITITTTLWLYACTHSLFTGFTLGLWFQHIFP